jgi:hypothetical protein
MQQATIYVTAEALAVARAIQDLNYYERVSLQDQEETDLSSREGYYLKNASRMRLAALPENAHVARRLGPEEHENYLRYVSFPANLRGCLFEKAPHIPEDYAEIVTYWSGLPTNTNVSGAAYFQNPQNEYMVDLTPLESAETNDEEASAAQEIDKLLSEGVVVCVSDVGNLIVGLSADDFIEVRIPVVPEMVGNEQDQFLSMRDYWLGPMPQYERIFLLVADIRRSPDANQIFVDVIRMELIDYGFYY